MPDRRQNTDHDLLIELRTEMQGVRSDIKEIKDGTAARLSALEADRVTQKEFQDHEDRIRFIEKYVWGAVGIIGLINLIGFAYIISKLTNH
jgi:hypothetical protein